MLLKAGKNVCSQLMNFKRLLEVQLSKQQCITTNPEEKIFFFKFSNAHRSNTTTKYSQPVYVHLQ